jgi:single-strand DNA-binding protein
MNHILVAGHLGADPEVRFTSSGQKVTTLRIASNVRKAGKDETVWWKITIWGEQFDKILPYFKKGSPIMVAGELAKPEIFMDKEGKPQISLNITANNIMFSPFGKTDARGTEDAQAKPSFQKTGGIAQNMQGSPFGSPGQMDTADFSHEEIPF